MNRMHNRCRLRGSQAHTLTVVGFAGFARPHECMNQLLGNSASCELRHSRRQVAGCSSESETGVVGVCGCQFCFSICIDRRSDHNIAPNEARHRTDILPSAQSGHHFTTRLAEDPTSSTCNIWRRGVARHHIAAGTERANKMCGGLAASQAHTVGMLLWW